MVRIGKVVFGVSLAVACIGTPAQATVVAGFDPANTVWPLSGGPFTVDLVADVSDDVFGWGVDLAMGTGGIVSLDSIAINGALWTAPGSSDDGLAGIGVPPGNSYSGNGLLLCTLTFSPLAIGDTDLFLSDDYPADQTEGWPLDPSGFDTDVTYNTGHIQITPEPAAFSLLVLGGLAVLRRRR